MHLHGKKAQATTELAIFGSLILVIFGALLSYGQRLNEEQAVTMDAFRYAVQRAGTDNGFVDYTVIKNKGLYDLMGSFLNPQSSSFSGNASILWAKGESDSRSYYRVNDDEIELQRIEKDTDQDDENGDAVKKDTPVEVWDTETQDVTHYAENTAKAEDGAGITTTQSAELQDRITLVLKTRFNEAKGDNESYVDADDVVVEQCLYRDENGKLRYSQAACSGAQPTVTKSQRWRTAW